MAELTQYKRRLIRRAVRDNVDVIRGRIRIRRPPKIERAARMSRIFFFLTVPLALFGASYLAASLVRPWFEMRAASAGRRTAELNRYAAQAYERAAQAQQQAAAELERLRHSGSPDAELAAGFALPAGPIDPAVFPLEVRRVVVDPGHGGENRGTKGAWGMMEKELALDISNRLAGLLEEASYDVLLTRTDDRFVSLEERARLANDRRGDLFVSIHLNWLETTQVRGIETYYLGPTDDPYLKKLAAMENKDSGYSIADFRSMLERVYADLRQNESRRLATSVQESLYNAVRRVNPTVQDRGVKTAPFIVLTGSEMPAILAEVACLSNEKEARLLMTAEYRQFIAEALFEGIDAFATEHSGTNQRGS